ncbi:MAG TPA: NADPH-dependent F420 reductase [Actinomycetota bacterium]
MSEHVAIVGGTGELGFGIALRLGRRGRRVVIGSRSAEKAADAVARVAEIIGEDAPVEGAENPEAVADARVVFVTVPYAGQAPTYKALKERWPEGAIVCDTTTPLATAVGAAATQVLRPWQGSAAEQAASYLPGHVRFVSGFHTVSAEVLEDLDHDPDCDVLLCGRDGEAKAAVGELVEEMAMRWVDAGPLTMARVVEPLTAALIRVNKAYGIRNAGFRVTGREAWGRPG